MQSLLPKSRFLYFEIPINLPLKDLDLPAAKTRQERFWGRRPISCPMGLQEGRSVPSRPQRLTSSWILPPCTLWRSILLRVAESFGWRGRSSGQILFAEFCRKVSTDGPNVGSKGPRQNARAVRDRFWSVQIGVAATVGPAGITIRGQGGIQRPTSRAPCGRWLFTPSGRRTPLRIAW